MSFPATYDFNYYRGDTFSFTIKPKQANNSAFQLDTYTSAKFVVAESRGISGASSAVPMTATIESVSDVVNCEITHTQGNKLDASKTYYYDVQISNETKVYTLLTGKITVQDDVTDTVAVG
jgi:hypothetical protein